MHDIFSFMVNNQKGLALSWLGNNGWLLCAGGHLIATDLDLYSKERISPSSIEIEKISEKLEYLLITHDHGDHFNAETCKFLSEHSNCRFILPKSCKPFAGEYGLSENRIQWVEPRQEISPVDWLQLKTMRAIHGHLKHSVFYDANFEDCGYFISFGGFNIMQPGDTVLLQEHIEMKGIDVLFVSPTEHNTHLEGSLTMIESIKPEHVFAQHFGTYTTDETNWFWTTGYPDELNNLLSHEMKKRFHKPVMDELIIINK